MCRRVVQLLSVWLGITFLVVSPIGLVTAQSTHQLSPSGGIGNTRVNFVQEWGPFRQVGGSFLVDRQEYAIYDTANPDFQLQVMFFLEADTKPRDTDRVGWFSLSLMESMDLGAAENLITDYLPEDAVLDRTLKNQYGDFRAVYSSPDALDMFPTMRVDGETISGKGEIWVTYGTMGEFSVVAIEIGLYDDYAT
jgi:hypothetical protein